MDALLSTGLKHIDAAYFVAKKLVEAKLAPHKIGMAHFTYDRDDVYVTISSHGKRVVVHAKCIRAEFNPFDIDGIVAKCKECGFTAGSVTEEQLAKHREAVEKAWNELCRSLSTLKVNFKYDNVSFLWVNYMADYQHDINLCTDRQDNMRILVQYLGPNVSTCTEPKEAASVLQLLHDFPLKEEGEK